MFLKFMIRLFGGNIEGEIKKINKDIKELLEIFREPRDPFGYLPDNKKAKKLLKNLLKEIEKYRKLLSKQYGHNLNNFRYIHKLENSINRLLSILERTHRLHKVLLDSDIAEAKKLLEDIYELWNTINKLQKYNFS